LKALQKHSIKIAIVGNQTPRKRIDLAIDRAERNYNHFDHINPALEESSTTVFRLVRELLKYTE
jgi:hypothetical protein